MVELTPARVAAIKTLFAAALAREMGYEDVGVREDLSSQLDLAIHGLDVSLRFKWCGREMLSSVEDTSAVESVALEFAADIADDLKEHRGRGERLPWDR